MKRFEPSTLSGAELDRFLERGWYRIGDGLITTDYLDWQGEIRSAIWTRLDLRGFEFKASLRKQMARNGRRFRTSVGERVLDAAHEELYVRYCEMVGGERARTLFDVLGGRAGLRLFNTREISVWCEDALVAFSWFDLGRHSLQSVIGVYDPAFRKYGLGFYTMLLEIAHGVELGMRYHYAGYVLGEPSCMDYKHRVGRLEHLDPATKRWLPDSPYAPSCSPAEVSRRRLGEAQEALEEAGISARCYVNSVLKIPGLLQQEPRCSREPLLLISTSPGHAMGILTTWDEEHGIYVLHGGRPIVINVEHGPDGEPIDAVAVRVFVQEKRLGERTTAEATVALLKQHLA